MTQCVLELRDKAKRFRETGMVAVVDTEATVVKSDNAIPAELEDALRAAVLSLEDVPEKQKNWHPGSDEKVLDLVHPSLFPLIYETTRVLPEGRVDLADCMEHCGGGEVIQLTAGKLERVTNSDFLVHALPHFWSKHFQWLPCETMFAPNDAVKITTYINNLHPVQHESLYGVVEQFIAKAIPLWDETLSRFHPRLRITVDEHEWDLPSPDKRPPQEDDPIDDEDALEEIVDEWIRENRMPVQPEPVEYVNKYYSPPDHPVSLRQDFKDQGLQIIVKLANIHLTAEKPDYAGGSWHVEGPLNEHICATAIYYYDSENVTDSFLEFRQHVDAEDMVMKPEQVNCSHQRMTLPVCFLLSNAGAAPSNKLPLGTDMSLLPLCTDLLSLPEVFFDEHSCSDHQS